MGGCTNSRIVQPLNKNQWQAAASLGGPIIEKDSRVEPIPLSNVSIAYGVTQSITVFSGLHPSIASYGIFQLDAGFSQEILTPFNLQPGITYSTILNGFIDRHETQFKLYPQIDINAYWLMPIRNDFFYIGISNWFELASSKVHDQKQKTRWIPSLHTGYTLQFNRYGFTTEIKYLAPGTNNQDLLVDYYSPNNKGSLAAFISLSRKY